MSGIEIFFEASGILFWLLVAIIGLCFANGLMWAERDPGLLHPSKRRKDERPWKRDE